jgi:hypothetical protein
MCYFYIFMNHCIKKVMKSQSEKRTIKNSQETERVCGQEFVARTKCPTIGIQVSVAKSFFCGLECGFYLSFVWRLV